MPNLASLCVSGGDLSSINYLHLEALAELKNLCALELHEFGSVDLTPLGTMPQLKAFALRYAKKIENIDTIGNMKQLEELVLDGLYIESLDFLDGLPTSTKLEMCGNHVYGGVDVRKWLRFTNRDICEISVEDRPYEHIDLSLLME